MTENTSKSARSREIVSVTRALFDEKGMREAQIEDIARGVGINRAIIYRHFSTKEELFAMVLVDYVSELEEKLAAARNPDVDAISELRLITDAYFDYGVRYPAFVECAQALLRFRGTELFDEIAPHRMLELGVAMGKCLEHTVEVFERGNAEGVFSIPDTDLLTNIVYTLGLGLLNLANFQMSVREVDPGTAVAEDIDVQRVTKFAEEALIAIALMDHSKY